MGGGEGKIAEESGKQQPKRILKKKETRRRRSRRSKKKKRRQTGRKVHPRVPQQWGCSNVTVAEELTREGSSRP